MATLQIDGDELVVHLSALEKLGAFHRDVRIPRSAVRSARAVERPAAEIRGLRAPGTGLPGVIALGTWRRGRRRRDFVAVYRGRPGVVVELDPQPSGLERLILSVRDPHEALRRLDR